MTADEIGAIARSPERFDTKVVEGVLALYNQMYSDRPTPGGNQTIGAHFTWVAPTMEFLADKNGIPPAAVKWSDAGDLKTFVELASTLLFRMNSAFRESLKSRRAAIEQKLDEAFRKLAVYSRYVIKDSSIEFISVPCLTGVIQCIAYALALLELDRHGLGSRVRACGYLYKEKPGSLAHHLFLTKDRRQKFCCPEHSNAQRQRVSRRKQATRKK